MNIQMQHRERLLETITRLTGVSLEQMRSRSRKRDIAFARHLYIWAMCVNNPENVKETTLDVRKDRTLFYHVIKVINNLIDTKDRQTLDVINAVRPFTRKKIPITEFMQLVYPHVNYIEIYPKCYMILEPNEDFTGLVVDVGRKTEVYFNKDKKFFERMLAYGNKVWFAEDEEEAINIINEFLS